MKERGKRDEIMGSVQKDDKEKKERGDEIMIAYISLRDMVLSF